MPTHDWSDEQLKAHAAVGAGRAPVGPGLADTSEQALKGTPDRLRQAERERILAYIARQGNAGATADEVERALSLPHQSASARISEAHRSGAIHFTDARRKTVRGRWARVYFSGPPPAGRATEAKAPEQQVELL